jgi:hypothetical protein
VEIEKFILQDLEYGEKMNNLENETQTLYDLQYGEEIEKTWKMRKAQCRT